ncbi:MAG: outer membrane protein [Alphaproteobacteria bacterium]
MNARALREALQQRNEELAVPSVDGSGRQEPSGFTASWNTDWDGGSYYSHGPQGSGSLPPLPPTPLSFSGSDADGNGSTGGTPPPNFHIDGTVSPTHASGNFGGLSGQGRGSESFPPPPSSWLEQVNSDFASRRDAYSSTPEKPPVPPKPNLSQNNISNAPTPAAPAVAAPVIPAAPAVAAANPGRKPPVPPKPNLSQNNTSNATTTAPVAAAANPGRKPPVPPKPNFSQNNSNVPTPAVAVAAAANPGGKPPVPPKPNFSQNNTSNATTTAAAAPVAAAAAAPVAAAAPAPVAAPIIPPAPPLPVAAAPAQQQRPSKLSSALKGISGGVFVGYGKQWNRFYLGLEATYLLSNEKANLDNLTFRKKNTAEVAIRPGFVVGHALFYGKIGFLSSQFKLADKPFRFNGMSLGCGADMKLSPKTLLGLGYTCEMYGKKKYIDQNNASLNLKPTSHRVMLRIGHRF